MKKTEVLFAAKSEVDSKSILNKSKKKPSNEILQKIENGVTIEDIDIMVKSGLPILKYHTQITIHGLFNELQNNYIYGYMNVFQNKNKSIGVKYNAIDEEKRKRIAKRLNIIGLRYSRNSTETKYSIIKAVDKENYNEVATELKELYDNVDRSLFFGNVSLWAGDSWGQKYLILDIYINAIYEANIEQFLNKLGATTEALEQQEKERKEYWEQQEIERQKEKAKQLKIREAQIELHKAELDSLIKYRRVEKTKIEGIYIQRVFNSDDKLKFQVAYVYLPKRAKKPRVNKTSFNTLKEALNFKPTETYSDRILGGSITGYLIN